MFVCGLLVVAVTIAVWEVVEARSAAPPPPVVAMPGAKK
jgi:hypothetical protein